MRTIPLVAGLFLALLFSGCSDWFCQDIPRKQKLADCNTNRFDFLVKWPRGNLFQIVLGVPYSDTNKLSFSGELVFRSGKDVILSVPIDSTNIQPCNWLENTPESPQLAGYILSWSQTNITQRLNDFKGEQNFDVAVRFEEAPPLTSSLWLNWLGQMDH